MIKSNFKNTFLLVSEVDSFMFQTVGHESLDLLAECMGDLPLFRGDLKRQSKVIGRDYIRNEADEVQKSWNAANTLEAEWVYSKVEDLFDLVQKARNEIEFEAVCSGAILSDYQRVRVENVWVEKVKSSFKHTRTISFEISDALD